MAKKKSKKKNSKLEFWKILTPLIIAILGSIGVTIAVSNHNGRFEVKIDYAPEPVIIEGQGGEYEEEIPTVDEIDGGGMFQDIVNIDGSEPDMYYELGAMEQVDTSSVQAFVQSTLNRCIVANNYYGAQCVSLARAFWWDYAGFDVSTCGTGLAKGMMNCSEQNAGDKFKVIWNKDEIIEGTWLVLDGKTTGHICMALTKPNGDYVRCLGENQGGIPCEGGIGGAGTNIINLSIKNFIGGYIPLTYIPPEPEPEPAPLPPDTGRL